ncbi:MAG: c-type cytochrome [Xanthomonadales bacterium]|nr:c-type cytochrome [Xanthomonadales bacterium]
MSDQDRIFMKNFALLVAGLVVFTIVIIIVATNLNSLTTRPENPDLVRATEERLKPPAEVYVGDEGAAALEEAEAEQEPATAAAAFDGSMDGELIYNNVCKACHGAGVAGSPKLVAAEWEARLEQGMDTLVEHAINGYQGQAGYMPPKGGRPDLSDEQVRTTVQWMVDNLE